MRLAYTEKNKKQGGKRTNTVEKRRSDDALTERLFKALKNENMDETISLLAAGADPNARNNNSWTALMYAAKYCPNAVELLLAAGADPNAKNNYGWMPLMFAAESSPETVGPLLASGADANVKDDRGRTSLMLAAEYHPEAIGSLLASGADANAKDDHGRTPLMLAAEYQPNAVGPLLASGADANAKDDRGRTPLMLAAKFQPEAVGPLLAAGADVNAKDKESWTPLMFAAWFYPKHLENLGAILAAGANPNARDEDGWTPLMFAAESPLDAEGPLVSILLAAGADPCVKNKKGKTVANLFRDRDRMTPEIEKLLKQTVARTNSEKGRNDRGYTERLEKPNMSLRPTGAPLPQSPQLGTGEKEKPKKTSASTENPSARRMRTSWRTAVTEPLSRMNTNSPKHLELVSRAARFAKGDVREELLAFIFPPDPGEIPLAERSRIFEAAESYMSATDIANMLSATDGISM